MLASMHLDNGFRLPDPASADDPRGVVLVAEDSPSQRMLLAAMLRKHGYRVLAVGDGTSALEVFEAEKPDVVISDVVMPGLSGVELCARVRAGESHPVHTILMSSREETGPILRGFEVGANDYIQKPLREADLVARVRAGLRVVAQQKTIYSGLRELRAAHVELLREHGSIDKELIAAATLQRALMPAPTAVCNGVVVSCGVKPCDRLGGDLVGSFNSGDDQVVVYSVDVAGHGVAAALLSTAVAQTLDPARSPSSPAYRSAARGGSVPARPHEVVAALNRRFQDWANSDRYFTIAYAIIDRRKARVDLCIAGHPAPAIVGADGHVRFLGEGGPPVGLLPDVRYETISCELRGGESIVLYSDAFPEATLADGQRLGSDGLSALIGQVVRAAPPGGLADGMIAALTMIGTGAPLTDDASVIAASV